MKYVTCHYNKKIYITVDDYAIDSQPTLVYFTTGFKWFILCWRCWKCRAVVVLYSSYL